MDVNGLWPGIPGWTLLTGAAVLGHHVALPPLIAKGLARRGSTMTVEDFPIWGHVDVLVTDDIKAGSSAFAAKISAHRRHSAGCILHGAEAASVSESMRETHEKSRKK